MDLEKPLPEPPKITLLGSLAYAGVALVMFSAGMLLESRLAARTATAVKVAHEQDLKQAEDKADQASRKSQQEKQALSDELAKERANHEKDVQAKDKSLAAVGSRAAGVRRTLETDLSAARASGEACTARIARISEALDGVFDSVGQVTGIAQDLGRENEQLKADNRTLSEKLAGWQKWNTERTQRVTVVGAKSG